MLYSQKQFGRDQLLTDLADLKGRLDKAWCSAGWSGPEGARCIIGHVNAVVGRELTARWVAVEQTEEDVRFGRMIWAIYNALLRDRAVSGIPVAQAVSVIISFNDRNANQGAVLLLCDRAVAFVQEQATVPVG